MDDLTREFLIESGEGLDRMERCLTDLEKSPGDAALVAGTRVGVTVAEAVDAEFHAS